MKDSICRTSGQCTDMSGQLEQALEVSEKDVKDASAGVLKDLKRFQQEKEEDLKRYMVTSGVLSEWKVGWLTYGQLAYARCHIHWAKRNVETWKEAKEEVNKIDVR